MERPLHGAMRRTQIGSLLLRYPAGDMTAEVQTPSFDGAEELMVQLWGVAVQESQPDAADVAQLDAVDKAVHGYVSPKPKC